MMYHYIMEPTYTRRNRGELNDVLRRVKEDDLLRKAGMLSSSSDPDSIFQSHEIRKTSPFGVLVVFGNRLEQEREMPGAAHCDSLEDLENLISVLQAYPKVGGDFFEEKRQAFINEVRRMQKAKANNGHSDKEIHRLANAVKNADMQKAWLEKENTDRLNKIKVIEEEIKGYEQELSRIDMNRPDNTEKIQQAIDATGPIKQSIEEDTQKLAELSAKLDNLKAEQELINEDASPATARLQKLEEERLTGEHNTLEMRIRAGQEKLHKIEMLIEYLRKENRDSEKATELTASLNRSKLNLEQAQSELAGGNKMVDNLDLRVQILASRLKSLQDASASLPNMRVAVLARAEELLNAWISSSRELQRILQVDGVSGKELIEALFFANGPLCASGTGSCAYLESVDVNLDTLMLYNSADEHSGFEHVEVFS